MILTMRELYDMFNFYPDVLHYHLQKGNEEDYIFTNIDMKDFVDIFGDSHVKKVSIRNECLDIILDVTLGDEE